jgi:bifunctional non-homologous end joining protein LigD
MTDPLATYRAKRDFARTPEPVGGAAGPSGDAFVVQKHAARRLHYDLRLELDGVLKSWAVAKGPSLIAGEKRLAVRTEDHPLDYGGFEGVIPKGAYGGGTVLLWDRGRWVPEGDPRAALEAGRLTFRLEGEKLGGTWHLVRTRRGGARQEHWLLIKARDAAARAADGPDILDEAPLSVASGRDLDAIAAPGDPPPDFVEPMLAATAAQAPDGPDWVHEIKHDGYRVQARIEGGSVRLLTRRGLDWTRRFASVARAMGKLPVRAALVDGEVVMEGPDGASDFGRLQEALAAGRSEGMAYYAFDLLHLDGRDLRRLPLLERKEALRGLLDHGGGDTRLRYSEHLETAGEATRRHACRLGLEGIVSKRRDAPYRSGRTEAWVKSKCALRDTFAVGGFTVNGGRLGSLVLGYLDGDVWRHAGRVGSGFSHDAAEALRVRLDRLRAERPVFEGAGGAEDRGVVWVRPELVADVEYRGWTRERRLRQASFKGLREDRQPEDAVLDAPPRAPRSPARSPARPAARLTNPDRVLWPDSGLTKRDLADYLLEVAPLLLPHVAGRPLSLVRCPSGIGEPCFFQKHRMPGLPGGVRLAEVEGEDEPLLAVEDAEGLAGLAQMGVIEIHPWGSRLEAPDRPDRLTFDLDPGEGVDWSATCAAALDIRDRLAAIGLDSVAKTTGGKGLHVVVPLEPLAGWEEAKAFAQGFARDLARSDPRFTARMAKSARPGRIFIDYLRNARGATAVAAFSPRARPGAPVSVPLAWEEVEAGLRPDRFTIRTLHRRIGSGADPWAGRLERRQRLPR